MKCDELKEHLFVPYSELQAGDELTDAITIAKSYYLKSEVDTAIAEKDAEIVKLKRALCLAMANGCADKIKYWHIQYKLAAGYDRSYEKWKHKLLIKWRNRWLAIAEKIKPNSTAK